MSKPVARLTRPAEMVASLPLQLGYTPEESLVVLCCHEPRGRVGLTIRVDLPEPVCEPDLVEEIEARVGATGATRVLLVVYTDEEPGEGLPRTALAHGLRDAFADLVVTDLLLVRRDRFWSYLCSNPACCPERGTPVDAARDSAAISLIASEQVLSGRAVLPSRAALSSSLQGPQLFAARVAEQRCEQAAELLEASVLSNGFTATAEGSLARWRAALGPASQGQMPSDHEAAWLVMSLFDVDVRDALAAESERRAPSLPALLGDLCRRTPDAFAAPVCGLLAWVGYCRGGGTEVTIAIERALRCDPDYNLARLLLSALQGQIAPEVLRKAAQAARMRLPKAG
jgi:hypothetical protein